MRGERARLLGVAYESTYVVTHSGKVFGWGDNENCELGPMGGSSTCVGHEYVTTPREFPLTGININEYRSALLEAMLGARFCSMMGQYGGGGEVLP
ncbi:Uncharacterised protein [Serratia fonticola]|uniref:Uncharacterized protein n=1 Tax=Serratia fonticola TaxID=47917 RepID=A0A4U9WE65_SERFO|nr:Uncharacterised protein [Serratia fonticola]